MTYKKIAIKLWDLLDDIDTAEDIYKPEITSFYNCIHKHQSKRFQYMGSDGYKLKRKWRTKGK